MKSDPLSTDTTPQNSALAKSDKYGAKRTNKPSHHFGPQEKNTRHSFDHTPPEPRFKSLDLCCSHRCWHFRATGSLTTQESLVSHSVVWPNSLDQFLSRWLGCVKSSQEPKTFEFTRPALTRLGQSIEQQWHEKHANTRKHLTGRSFNCSHHLR